MKKFFTLLFLLLVGFIAPNAVKSANQIKHSKIPMVLSEAYLSGTNHYFPWINTTNHALMAACPGDIAVTADPGECARVITYDFDLVPENPPSQTEVTQNNNPDLVNATIYCPFGQTRYRRTFQNTGPTDFILNSLSIGVYQSSNSPSVTVNVFSSADELLYTTSAIVPNLSMTTYSIDLGNTLIPAGQSYSIEVVTPPPFVSIFRMGRNDAGNTTNEAQITSESCTPAQMLVSGAVGANSIVMSVTGTPEEFIVINNSLHGYESGDEFPIGNYAMDYQVVNWEGDEVLSCQFTIDVFAYQSQNTALACNDQVNITLGAECQAEVSAGHILKGDFYTCFDEYTVNITSPQGWSLGNTVGYNEIGKILRVTVTAPDGNSCWGHILVEDKYGPQLTCNDVYTTCIGDLSPGSPLSSRINLPAFLEENILFPGTPNSRSYTIPVNGFSSQSISDVGVHLNIAHTRVSDLVATVMAPNGQSVTLFVSPGGNVGPCAEDNIAVNIFDNAVSSHLDLQNTCNASVPAIEGDFKPLTPLSIFDGISPDGNWVITIHDIANGEGGFINDVTLSFNQSGAVIPFPYPDPVNWVELGNQTYWIEGGDDCTDAILTYTDQILQEGCEGPYVRVIQRCWGGFDDYDNPANQCCQTIYVYRNGLSAVNFPPDYDNIEEPALSCAIFGDSIPGLEVTGTITGDFCDNIQIVPYTDIIIPICEKSYKIIRTHKIIEWCNNIVLEHNQIIKVIDDQGPEISCPDDMTISTNQYDCFATRAFDRPEILFDCSDEFTYTLSAAFGPYSGEFPCGEGNFSQNNVNQATRTITGLPVGNNFVRWSVKDECDNVSDCCFRVHVRDDIRPTAVCHDFTIVSIAANQQAIINVASFDDGSHDNCGILDIEVRKMTNACAAGSTNFGHQAIFCCAEIGQEIMVEMKVTDIHNNMNTCMVRAQVQDKLPPYIKCPVDVTLDCQEDYTNPDLTGEPTAVDNCSVKDVTAVDDPFISQCGTGYVRRVWTAVDFQDLKHSCVQTITLVDFDPFDKNDIVWPQNYTTDQCGAALLPENLPAPFNKPVINDDECSLIGVQYKDQVFTFVDGACEKILRTWTVIDWCTYDENYPVLGQGWYEHVQIIKMHNEVAPVFETPCTDRTVFSYGPCEGEVEESVIVSDVCTPADLIGVNYTIDLFNDNSVNLSGNGKSYKRVLPDGTHKVRWTAEDKCGNISVCEYLLTVIDGKKPTPYCLSSVTTAVMNTNGKVEIWARDFDLGSSDNCTPQEELWITFDGARPVRGNEHIEHYFNGDGSASNILEYLDGNAQKWIPATKTSGRVFTCRDIPNGVSEEVSIDMSVWDRAGNMDFCTVKLVLQDNSDACEDQGGNVGSVSGRINLADNRPLKNVSVVMESNQPEYPKTIIASQTGAFQFSGIKKNFNYQMSAQMNDDIAKGISTLDLVFIQRHILGMQYFNNPYNAIAADIDGNEKINSVDLVNLRKVILGTLTELPNQQKSWRFIPANHSFPNMNEPWPLVDRYNYPNFSQNLTNQNFIAVKTGDVNNSIVLNVQGDPTESRVQETLTFMADEVKAAKGETVRIPVYMEGCKDILGYQFTAAFDPTLFTLESIQPGKLAVGDENIGVFEDKPGMFTMSWHSIQPVEIASDEAAFYLVVAANEDFRLNNILTINGEITDAMAFDKTYRILKTDFRSLSKDSGNQNQVFAVRQNVPNPFADQTVISFTIPSDNTVKLSVMDVSGRLVYTSEAYYEAGSHQIKLDKTNVHQTGVMYYQITAGEHTATRKMVLIE